MLTSYFRSSHQGVLFTEHLGATASNTLRSGISVHTEKRIEKSIEQLISMFRPFAIFEKSFILDVQLNAPLAMFIFYLNSPYYAWRKLRKVILFNISECSWFS